MFKRIRKYFSLDKRERKLLNRAFIWLIYAFVLVRIIPLRWFSNILGEFNNVEVFNESEVEAEYGREQLELIRMVKRNLRRIKKRLPWKVKCFEEAIAAKKMLDWLGIECSLFLGVAKEGEKDLKAHAWIKSSGYFVSGEKGYQKFTVVGFYR